MIDIEKMDLESKDLIDDCLEKLRDSLFEIFSESGVDLDKLRILLGDEVDEGLERYMSTWPSKTGAIRQSQAVSTTTFRPYLEENRSRDGKNDSSNSDNIYIKSDNLEVLKLLQRGYRGRVKMIYIDPPYSTGHDFVYRDEFSDTIEDYKEQAGLTSQPDTETNGCYHSD